MLLCEFTWLPKFFSFDLRVNFLESIYMFSFEYISCGSNIAKCSLFVKIDGLNLDGFTYAFIYLFFFKFHAVVALKSLH